MSMNKPKGKVRIVWSPAFAYAIGLIVSDGNLSPDGRHINFTTKDLELAEKFLVALGIPDSHIGKKSRASEEEKRYYCIQFSDVLFYRFLVAIGLMPNKSRLLSAIVVPDEFFSHFIRGLFDGDGTSCSYWDKRWRSSFMYYTGFSSASPIFIRWLQERIVKFYGIRGAISKAQGRSVEQLMFAKKATVLLVDTMYGNAGDLYLSRKHLKIFQAFSILPPPSENARVEKR